MASPATHNAPQKSPGDKNKEVRGIKCKIGKLKIIKIVDLLPLDAIFYD